MTRTLRLAAWLGLAAAPCAAEAPASGRKIPATPIRHLVVLFQENVSFDHYFATYPRALNKPGEPPFTPRRDTPTVNGLTATLLEHNPNAVAPFRLGRAHAATCYNDHHYPAEQRAYHAGLLDRFVEESGPRGAGCDPATVMAYFDGNTVTALWNYAQHFALSDDFYGATFGPSTVGALNLVSGQTHGAVPEDLGPADNPFTARGTLVADADPALDDCSGTTVVRMTGVNVGDLLNRAGISWGWFAGGFRPTSRGKDGRAVCGSSHTGSDGRPMRDYLPHHEPFQYYRSTANPHHLPPSSPARVGLDDAAHHQYDLSDFWAAAEAGDVPAVSFLKAPAYEEGHAGYSDPVHEQAYLVETINRLERLPEWKDMAVLIAYDDSDGGYDHVMPPIVNRSADAETDALSGPGACGAPAPGAYPSRCGYGPRVPLLAVSPFARENFVDHALTDQTSILRFLEDNWGLGRIGDQSLDALAGPLLQLFDFDGPRREPLFLEPATGEPRGAR